MRDFVINSNKPKDSISNWTIRLGNRVLDRFAGVASNEVLNPEPWLEGPDEPARILFQSASAMKAEAVDPLTGQVDYAALADSEAYQRFQEVARSLPNCEPAQITDRDERIAFWINLYNALILDAVVRYQIRGSLLRHFGVFRRAAYNVSGMRFSADEIEHGVLRGNRRNPTLPFPPFSPGDPRLDLAIEPPDPRIHFALVCGARSCPPIAFYSGDRLNHQLDQAAANFINGGAVRLDAEKNTLWLSKIFGWYEDDFGGRDGVLKTIERYWDDEAGIEFLSEGSLKIRYMTYDWSVNALT
jgi:hypothetical protein